MEMSLVPVPVAMRVFVIVRVLMPEVVFVFMTVMMCVVMLVAVLVGMLMFVSVIVFVVVLMVVFMFFAHGFVIPSNEIRFIFAHLHCR